MKSILSHNATFDIFQSFHGRNNNQYEYNNFLLPQKLLLIQSFASRFHEMQHSNGAYKLFSFARKIWRCNCVSDSFD